MKLGISGNRLLCADCKEELPGSVADYRDGLRPVTLAVLGAKESGKSNFIAVLVEWIKQSTTEFEWCIWGMNDDTVDRYREDFYKSIFEEKRPVDFTLSGTTHSKTNRPLLFALSLKRQGWRPPRMIFLTFYDAAGEDLRATSTMAKVNRYIAGCRGIIYLMDPLQLPAARDLVDTSTRLPSRNANVEDTISKIANFIKSVKNLPGDQIPIPFAAAFTKMDVLLPYLPPDTALRHASKHTGGFHQADFDDVHGEMRALLHEWNAHAVTTQVERRFPTHGYFGISALGCNPGPGDPIREVKPIRILDPLIWHLSLHGFLPTRE